MSDRGRIPRAFTDTFNAA
ncbi:hypothetical protein [Mycobacterium sp.]